MAFETDIRAALTRLRSELREVKADLSTVLGPGGTPLAASETTAGIIRVANQGDVDAGTSNEVAVSPLRLASRLAAFAQPLNANLTALAGVVTGATGLSLLGATSPSAAKTTLSLGKSDVGLSNVDNTSDASKPISTAQQTALNLKADTTALPTKASLGLGNVDNTSDVNKPISTAQQTALNLKADTTALPTKTSLGLANVDNTSDVNKPVSTAQQTALNLKADTTALPTKTSLGLANVDNTSDVNKPVSTAQQTALNLKANVDSPTLTGTPSAPTPTVGTNSTRLATTAFTVSAISSATPAASETVSGILELATQTETNTGTDDLRVVTPLKFHTRLLAYAQPLSSNLTTLAGVVSGAMGRTLLAASDAAAAKSALSLSKEDVGLANVDNTADSAKPISTAQQTALNLKADTTALPTKSSLGLANVDNTSDVNKPVSTAQQSALDLKANLDSPILVGTPMAPTVMSGDSTDKLATTNYVQAAIGDITGGSAGVIDGGGVNEGYPTPPDLHDGGTP